MAKGKLGKQNIINRENKDLFDLFEKYPEMESNFTPTTGKFIQQKNKNDFAEFDLDNYKKILFAQEIINNPNSTERQVALAKTRLQRLKKSDTSGRGKRPPEVKSNQEQMERRNITKSQENPILDGDDEKKSFFDRLLSKENRPFLENLGMQLGTNLTAPMNPGENRSLMNQVARSVQGASAQTSAQEKAEIDKLLSTAQAKKALSESSGIPDEYKVAYAEVKSRGEPKEFIISEGKNIKNPAFGVAVANVQARNTSSVGMTKDRIDGLEKLVKLQSSLATTGLGESEKLEITNAINMIKKELGITGSGKSGSNDIDLSKKKTIGNSNN